MVCVRNLMFLPVNLNQNWNTAEVTIDNSFYAIKSSMICMSNIKECKTFENGGTQSLFVIWREKVFWKSKANQINCCHCDHELCLAAIYVINRFGNELLFSQMHQSLIFNCSSAFNDPFFFIWNVRNAEKEMWK